MSDSVLEGTLPYKLCSCCLLPVCGGCLIRYREFAIPLNLRQEWISLLFPLALFSLIKSSAHESSTGGEALLRSRVGNSSVLRTVGVVSISDKPNENRSWDDKDP